MAVRTLLGCLPAAALVVCGCGGSKDQEPPAKSQPSAADLDRQCDAVGKVCGDSDKHMAKIADECKQLAKKQVDKGCADKALATNDCYVKELCGGNEKVWALEDLPVLADRHAKCVAERAASRACTEK